ncbi:hypothetical protein [Nitrospirillum iridis]|uniref:Uncharacterized protein n=1 Tax=Nitrospirillum iridis TaxID=765888 RepID=A0A7X0B041_9PROT|nr:hypothetical protein [Nitrospirillum iridis]MBB6251709.1 hypothetical protein [Nitrospirillum iridis]
MRLTGKALLAAGAVAVAVAVVVGGAVFWQSRRFTNAPDGFGGLRLGMTIAEAEQVGLDPWGSNYPPPESLKVFKMKGQPVTFNGAAAESTATFLRGVLDAIDFSYGACPGGLFDAFKSLYGGGYKKEEFPNDVSYEWQNEKVTVFFIHSKYSNGEYCSAKIADSKLLESHRKIMMEWIGPSQSMSNQ